MAIDILFDIFPLFVRPLSVNILLSSFHLPLNAASLGPTISVYFTKKRNTSFEVFLYNFVQRGFLPSQFNTKIFMKQNGLYYDYSKR